MFSHRRAFYLLLFFLLPLAACRPWYAKRVNGWEENKPPLDETLRSATYLIGDAGKWEQGDLMQQTVQSQLHQTPDSATVVYLGDNIYEWGLTDTAVKDYAKTKYYLDAQLHATDGFNGPVVFIPGNHDWAASYKEAPGGLANLKRQEVAVAKYGSNYSFLPTNGCPGPTVKKLPNGWTLIVLDTQWWVQTGRPEGVGCKCPQPTEQAVLRALDSLLQIHKGQKTIVVGHHPVYDNGTHGGHFTLRDHIFPLTAFNKYLWIPLPLIGSGIIAGRMMIKHFTDQTHPGYKRLATGLKTMLKRYPNVIYAAGHEHNLQYHNRDGVHYIVTGSAAKASGVSQGHTAEYVDTHRGFTVVKEYANGQVWVEYLIQGKYPSEKRVSYRRLLYTIPSQAAAIRH
jgi:hypothetical protein